MMIYSLFDSFDFSMTSLSLKLSIFLWLSFLFIFFSSMNTNKWEFILMNEFYKFIMFSNINNIMNKSSKSFMGMKLVMTNILMFVIFLNLSGMFPYVFPLTSHMSFSFSMGLILWLTILNKGFENSNVNLLTHLVPSNMNFGMSGFLFLVELVSHQIRPLTVSFRLSANITAGHIIFSMINLMILFKNWALVFLSFNYLIIVLVSIFYMMFEFWVMIVQAIVFVLLFFLYIEDYL